MSERRSDEVTRLLTQISQGDFRAEDKLFPIVYSELREIAGSYMRRERPDHTLQPTALVHEAYLRLVGDANVQWNDRAHFFAAAAEAMRRILIEHARRRSRAKHGGGRRPVPLVEEVVGSTLPPPEQLLELDRLLSRLESEDATMAAVVKLRYFAGLTVPETARALQTSPRTVNRQWRAARAWLLMELEEGAGSD